MLRRVLLPLLLLLPPATGWAAPPAPPPVWSGKAAISFVAAAGNSNAETLGASGEVAYRPHQWSVVAQGSFVRSRTDGTLSAESLTSQLRATRQLTTRIQGYTQLDYLKNRFAGIDSRVAFDGGLAWNLLPSSATQSLKVVGGLGYTHEANLPATTQAFATDNAGVRYAWQLSKTAEVTDNGLFTGSLSRAADWRVTNTVTISATINAIFSLKLSHRLDFVNVPVPGFRQADQLISAAIVASF